MTRKLYYENSGLYEFEAEVLSLFSENGRYGVVLSATAFFPGGGGQPCDEGTLNGEKAEEVTERGEEIIHWFGSIPSFAVGDTVRGVLDRDLRFSRMQAHSGEHVVSGVAHNLYGIENVGFHMDGLLMTVDFDKVLSKEQIARLEKEANACVYKDLPVTAVICSPEEAEAVDYRSKKQFEKDIRIVTVEGVDRCACCAPHVSRTGEIGLIKICSCVSHRGGVRLTLLCGSAAYEDYRVKYDQTLEVASLLAVKHHELMPGVEKLLEQISELKNDSVLLKKKYCQLVTDSVPADGKTSVLFINADPEEARMISLGAAEKTGALSVVCSGSDENGYSYVITKKGTVMNRFAKEINAALDGRGGGRDEMIQGSFRTSEKAIRSFFENYEVI